MKLQQILCLFLATACAADFAAIVDPRGNRPVQPGYKADKCATEKEWPFCTDDDWGPKCPSGCRIQGLLDKTDHDLLKRIDKIRQLLDENRQRYRSTDQSSKQTYDYLRDRLTTSSGDDTRYMSLAESLRKRIVDIKIKIERQLNMMETLKKLVRNQVIDMQRLEVDIDIKLRACKGSCAQHAGFSVDRESYVAIDKQMDQLESMRVNSVETVGALRVMKSRVLKDVVVPSVYKSGLTAETQEQKQYFTDLSQPQLTLQAEGATADAPATVSKFPGTASSSSSSSLDSSSRLSLPSSSSKFPGTASSSSTSFSESSSRLSMSGSGSNLPGTASSSSSSSSSSSPDSSSRLTTTTHTMQCTRTTRKVVTHTKDGPVEKLETVLTGEGCDAMGGSDRSMTSLTQGGDTDFFGGDFFKGFGGLGDASSKFGSSGSTKTMSSTKSMLSSTKSGSDFGAFGRGDADEDLPDIFARSGKTGTP